MATNFPTSKDDLDPTRGAAGDTLSSPSHATHHQNEDDAIEALQDKVGINSSADTASLDYKVSNVASSNPGHTHTLNNTSDVDITTPLDGQALLYNDGTGNWENETSTVPDASTGTKGITTMSVAPVVAATPIAVGDNDGRVPTQDENDALVGSDGTPSSTNKFATESGIQDSVSVFAADAEASDTYAITLSPAPSAYATGQRFIFTANTANTGASTLNVNALGAKTIKKQHNVDTATGDIESGQVVEVVYDGTNFQMVSQTASLVDVQEYTSDDTWNKPEGAKLVIVDLWGGGGSGAGTNNTTKYEAGGGGGGAYLRATLLPADLGASETVTVGVGGVARTSASNSNGAGGEASSFGSHATAGGGSGGIASSTDGDGGAGGINGGLAMASGEYSELFGPAGEETVDKGNGSGAGGDGLYSGGGGATQADGGNSVYGGGGGAGDGSTTGGTSMLGGAGGNGGQTADATAGSVPGGGGGGCDSASAHSSGAGGDGKVIVTTYL